MAVERIYARRELLLAGAALGAAWVIVSGCNGCKGPGPRELVCRSVAYYEVLNPEQGTGKALFSIERLGREVKGISRYPDLLVFRDNRVMIGWMLSDVGLTSDATYSPDEGLLRDVEEPDFVLPVKRFSDGKSERARLGFRSTVCREPNEHGSNYGCALTENELVLATDMTCRWELINPREWDEPQVD
jgi:hypothetical protein